MKDVTRDAGIITSKEVAAMLRTSPETVRRRCREGRMPHFRLFGQIRFRRSQIEDWIDALCREGRGNQGVENSEY